MEEENGVQVDVTTEDSQPEANTDEAEVPETPQEEPQAEEKQAEDEGESSEETENTTEAETEKPKSRASERIRQLIAEKKAAEARAQALEHRQPQELDGIEKDGIDPHRFAESVSRNAEARADQRYQYNRSMDEAIRKFPIVAENELVGTRATALQSQGYDPVEAAEIASLEYKEEMRKEAEANSKRQAAAKKMRDGAALSTAGKSSASREGMFTRSEIAAMSPQDYTKNQNAIQKQLEKFGAESFEDK